MGLVTWVWLGLVWLGLAWFRVGMLAWNIVVNDNELSCFEYSLQELHPHTEVNTLKYIHYG